MGSLFREISIMVHFPWTRLQCRGCAAHLCRYYG